MGYKVGARKRKFGAIVPYGSRAIVPYKRRRFVRRRRFGTSRALGFNSRSLRASNIFAPRARKLRKRALRRLLWRETLTSEHYKSISSDNSAVLNTPTNTGQINWIRRDALNHTAGNEFWKTAGGCQDPSFGVVTNWMAAPGAGIFDPVRAVIRGGRLWISLANPDPVDTVQVRVQLAFIRQQQRNAADGAASNTYVDWENAIIAGGSRPFGWQIFEVPDASEYIYRPVLDKTFDLKASDDVFIAWKIKPVKLDCRQFQNGGGSWFPMWFIYAGQRINNTVGAVTMNVLHGHNLSFAVTDIAS